MTITNILTTIDNHALQRVLEKLGLWRVGRDADVSLCPFIDQGDRLRPAPVDRL